MAEAEFTVAEAAVYAGVSDRTIRNWINDGELEARNTPNGRRVRRADLVEFLRKRGYHPPELENLVVSVDAGSLATNGVEGHVAPQEAPKDPGTAPTPALTPELINVVLQPLVEQLNAANARAEKKERENLELAGRVGYLQAKVQQYEERVLLLEAPKDGSVGSPEPLPLTQPPSAAPDATPEKKPWYKRLLALE